MEMETLYTINEASKYLKVSAVSIRRYIKEGKLETHRVGRQHRISETALKNFLNLQYKAGGVTNE